MTAHAVKHADEAARVIEIGDDGVLGNLKAHLAGQRARAIETFDHELKKLHVAQGLPGDIDGHAAIGGHRERAAAKPREGGLYDPARNEPHQAVALGGAHKIRGRHVIARFIAHAHEHLHRRSAAVRTVGGHDDLLVEMKAVFLERTLQALQPLDLAGMTRVGLIARGVDGHVPGALLLGDVARRIGRGEQLFERAALAGDLDDAHGDADVEDLVAPYETIVTHRTAHVVRDLLRLLERTADEQHSKLIPAEACNRVAVAHRIAQQLGNFAQHAVTGEVAARIIDGLEAVKIQVAQHVLTIAAVAALDCPLAAQLEIAPIYQTYKRSVGRLIRHLARKSAQLS